MRFSGRYLCTVLLTILSLPTLLAAQTTTQQSSSKPPRGSVSGRITIKEKAVAGVVVGLRKTEQFTPFEPFQKATTDADGFYRITNVAPGNYEVVPSTPAYVMADKKDPRGRQILVGEDEDVDGINFSLVRGGVITGRVTDADGRPVIQQQVTIFVETDFRQSPQQSQRPFFATQSVPTDDRGIYRVYGLQPGRYKVASGRGDDGYSSGASPGRYSFKQVFYPDVTEQEKATVIDVTEGSEANNIDIALGRPLQTFTASGRVIDGEKGLPMPNIRFTFQRSIGERAEFVNILATSNTQGEFTVEGLLPGKYGVYLFPNQLQTTELRADALSFEIIDQDVTGVVVKLLKGASVSGVVVVETENKAVLAKLSELQLRGFIPQPGGVVSSASSGPIAPDGSFRLAGLGTGTLRLNLATATRPFPPKGFSIARVERDGVALPRGLELKDGEQVIGVRVVLSYGSATLRGVVTFENGPLPAGLSVQLHMSKQGEASPNNTIRQMVDERGRFMIEGIPAGTYELLTFVNKRAEPSAPSGMTRRVVTIQEGTTQDITIAVEMPSSPTALPARP